MKFMNLLNHKKKNLENRKKYLRSKKNKSETGIWLYRKTLLSFVNSFKTMKQRKIELKRDY
jgi:hypothetical protein